MSTSAGHLGALTPAQESALTTLRTTVSAPQDATSPIPHPLPARIDDACLLRFLRARRFDVGKTVAMLTETEAWRKENNVDSILDEFDFPEKRAVNGIYPQFYHGTDREGRPVYYEILGGLDLAALYRVTTEERMIKRLIWEYERCNAYRLPGCSAAAGHRVETFFTVLDISSVSLSQFYRVSSFIRTASSIGQNRYPETMGKFYLINAPYLFSSIWSLIKNSGWLDEVTVRKISILGRAYQPELRREIGEDNLPREFGGTCVCPGEGGCRMSDLGPWVVVGTAERQMRRAAHDAVVDDGAADVIVPEHDGTSLPAPL